MALLLWDNIVMLPTVNQMIWNDAKLMAILMEAKLQCAQIRIAAFTRKISNKLAFSNLRNAVNCISKTIKGQIAKRNMSRFLYAAENDRKFRRRYFYAMTCQKAWRRYHWRNLFLKQKETRAASEVEMLRLRRAEMHKRRKLRESKVVFRQVRPIQATMTKIIMFLWEKGRPSEEYCLTIKVYVPHTQETFRFNLEESTVRDCLETALVSKGKLSWDEMLKFEALTRIAERLMVRIVNRRPIILFSRRSISERGMLISKSCESISGRLYVLSVFCSPFDFVFCAYDAKTCEQLRTKIESSKLCDWLQEEGLKQRNHNDRVTRTKYQDEPLDTTQYRRRSNCTKDNTSFPTSFGKASSQQSKPFSKKKGDEELSVMKEIHQKDVVIWLINRLLIEKDETNQSTRLLLKCVSDEKKRLLMIKKVQSLWSIIPIDKSNVHGTESQSTLKIHSSKNEGAFVSEPKQKSKKELARKPLDKINGLFHNAMNNAGNDAAGAKPEVVKTDLKKEARKKIIKPCKKIETKNTNDPPKIDDCEEKCKKSPKSVPPKVPVPIPCLVDVVEGSVDVKIWNNRHHLNHGDWIRIHSAHGHDWQISPENPTPLIRSHFQLSRPYNHIAATGKKVVNAENLENTLRKKVNSNDFGTEGEIAKVYEHGFEFSELRAWKLIPKGEDNRPKWRKQYDDGDVPWEECFKDKIDQIEHFNVKIALHSIESCCRDCINGDVKHIHQQRVNYFQKIPVSKILEETFNAICQWHPVTQGIDYVRWAKFAKKMGLLSNLKNSAHEVYMSFMRQTKSRKERRLDIKGFNEIIKDVAIIQEPKLHDNAGVSEAFKIPCYFLFSSKKFISAFDS